MRYLFGYGSLVSPASASKTLNREISADSLEDVVLPGFIRSWDIEIPVLVDDREVQEMASFLNLRPSDSARCNGVLLEVTDSELVTMDIRERGYARRKVEVLRGGVPTEVETYIATPNTSEPRTVLAGYLAILEDALLSRAPEFASAFWESTDSIPTNVVGGRYQFADPEQNRATGR